MRIELERLVPTSDAVMPFLWVRGADHATFEQRVRENPAIGTVDALDRADDWVLYRVEWADEPFSLLEIINTSGASSWRVTATPSGSSACGSHTTMRSRRSTISARRRISPSTSSGRTRSPRRPRPATGSTSRSPSGRHSCWRSTRATSSRRASRHSRTSPPNSGFPSRPSLTGCAAATRKSSNKLCSPRPPTSSDLSIRAPPS